MNNHPQKEGPVLVQQAIDFRDESEMLYQLLEPLPDKDLERKTLFKGWTINQVLRHLHLWNWAAGQSLNDPDRFQAFMADLMQRLPEMGLRAYEYERAEGRRGGELLQAWRNRYREITRRFAHTDPQKRVKWAGPDMSVLSSITARLMETWAHGQAVYDVLGVERVDSDRIYNIAQLGVNTFGWTFKNRGLDVPPIPLIRLTAPSGEIWEWNAENTADTIEGAATEFCQVVTQTRNVADTQLRVSGEVAKRWISVAQCFAGPPTDPPAPGSRHIAAN
jgi:uncharacterized protein (TIGR03084 family)